MCALYAPKIYDYNQTEKQAIRTSPWHALVYNQPVYDESLFSFPT